MSNRCFWLMIVAAAIPLCVCQLENEGKIWALLVAGSNSYMNYRHQADVCHSYQILHANGIPDENIIVMMYDDIAYNEDNPTPGIIINQPNGTNVYEGVPKDYTGKKIPFGSLFLYRKMAPQTTVSNPQTTDPTSRTFAEDGDNPSPKHVQSKRDVNPENFLRVLSGNEKAMRNIGSGRVLKSGPKDHIFVYFSDHGAPGLLGFPDSLLHATDLEDTLRGMADNNQFAKMVLYVEACESGSMFESILPDDLNVFVVTAADPHESSYACYYDEMRQAYLGDVFSVYWMQDAEKENLLRETLHHQFEIVRAETNTSHVEEYGDLDLGAMHVSEFIGFQITNDILPSKHFPNPLEDALSSHDVPVGVLEKRLKTAVSEKERKKISFELHKILKLRRNMDIIVENIMLKANGDKMYEEWEVNTYKLNKKNYSCYRHLVTQFSKWCYKLPENSYALTHLHKFAGVCSGQFSIANEETTAAAIKSICSSRQLESGVV